MSSSLSDSSSHGGEDSDPTTESSPKSQDANREVYRTAARDLGKPVACAKLPKGQTLADDHQILVKTNIHGIRMNLDPETLVYQYHVNLMKRHKDKSGNNVEFPVFNPQGCDTDYFKVNRRRMTTKIFKVLCDVYPVFGSPDNFVYDSANTLFTFQKLPKDRKIYEIDEDLSTQWLGRKNQIYLEVVNVNDPVEFNVKDFSHISRDFKIYNQEVIRFLELATSHYTINHHDEHIMYNNTATYFMDPTRYGYHASDVRDLGNGKYISVGASKNVLSIEGPTMRAAAALSIDSKKVLYYHTGTLLELICRLCDIRNHRGTFDSRHFVRIRSFIKRLVCHRTYGNFGSRTIVLHDIRPMTADTYTFTNEKTAETRTVQQYLRETYQIELECAHWPMVCEMNANKTLSFYPIETLRVADFQRVGGGTTPDDIREIIRSTAVAPAVKQVEAERSYRSFTFEKNVFMKTMGISIMEKPIIVSARLLMAPNIQYANGNDQPQLNGTWRMNKQALFLKPGVCESWACVLIESGNATNFEEFKNFGRMYWAEANKRGFQMPQPLDCLCVAADREALKDVFASAVNMKCKFLLIGHPDKENTLHGEIKCLERAHGITTQCVKTSTLSKVAANRSQLTLENLVLKGNVKMGGLNYSIKLRTMPIDEKVLFIGFGMSAPGGGFGTVTPTEEKEGATETAKKASYSVVGYAANDSELHDEFTGNFLLQPSFRDEKVIVSQIIFEDVFTRYLKNHNNQAPSRVILYRNGCTEGQFGDVLRYEIPHLRMAMKKHFNACSTNKIPLTVIVPSKVHSVRFFNSTINPQDKAMDQNISPGVVIDSAVTHSAFCEFYLNSHRAIQGTAKTPKYSIIYNDDATATLDMFERWTNALCYDFQIVNSPTSLPAPAYIANRYAERGRMLLNTYDLTSSNNHNRGAPKNHEGSPEGAIAEDHAEDVHEDEDSGSGSGHSLHADLLSQHFYVHSLQLNYTERPDLRNRRINA